MTALYIIGVILGLIVFIAFGYYLWSTAKKIYNYNIFGLGVIIRGLVSLGCLFLAFSMSEQNDGSGLILIIIVAILWFWTFLVTWVKSNFFIAFFSVIYQIFAVIFVKSVINRLLKVLN